MQDMPKECRAMMETMPQACMDAMQQMMQGQKGGGDAPASAGAEVAVPQTPDEIRAYLDQLDAKLMAGSISESVYERLYAKWEARLKELGG